MTFHEIFETYTSVAVFGMSTNPSKPAHYVPAFMMEKGYDVIPINPVAEEIAGRKAYKTIADVPEKIDILNVFRPSEQCLEVVEEAINRKRRTGDIQLIWLQEGIINEAARKLAEENGIDFIQNHCMMKEYNML